MFFVAVDQQIKPDGEKASHLDLHQGKEKVLQSGNLCT